MKEGIILILSLLCWPVWAQTIPDFSALYKVDINGLPAGELKRSLTTVQSGERVFRSEMQAKGIFALFKPDRVTESSRFTQHNGRIIPLRYLYQRTGGKKEKMLSLDFDWEKKQIHIDDKIHPWSLPIQDKILDKLVYQLALMSDLANGQSPFDYHIADGGKIKHYLITPLGEEVITTPLGKIKTVKLTRQRKKKSQRKTTLWCAPQLHFLPVKLEHVEKGGAVFTAKLRHLKGIDTQHAFISRVHPSPVFGPH